MFEFTRIEKEPEKQMRLPRLILEPEACGYHCVARTIDKIWFFDTPIRRDCIQDIIQSCAELYSISLFNHVIMSNHIHLLTQVQKVENREPLTKRSLLRLAAILYSKNYVTQLKIEFKRAEQIDAQTGDRWHSQNILDRFEARRGCLSIFMQAVKERIAKYVNREHHRKGTVWDGRYKNPIVEKSLESLLAVSALSLIHI